MMLRRPVVKGVRLHSFMSAILLAILLLCASPPALGQPTPLSGASAYNNTIAHGVMPVNASGQAVGASPATVQPLLASQPPGLSDFRSAGGLRGDGPAPPPQTPPPLVQSNVRPPGQGPVVPPAFVAPPQSPVQGGWQSVFPPSQNQWPANPTQPQPWQPQPQPWQPPAMVVMTPNNYRSPFSPLRPEDIVSGGGGGGLGADDNPLLPQAPPSNTVPAAPIPAASAAPTIASMQDRLSGPLPSVSVPAAPSQPFNSGPIAPKDPYASVQIIGDLPLLTRPIVVDVTWMPTPTIADTSAPYRPDNRCGKDYPVFNGQHARCRTAPCCSLLGWCGDGDQYCRCEGCVDYRNPSPE